MIAVAAMAMTIITPAMIGSLRPFGFALVSRPSLIGAVSLRGEFGAEVRAAAFASVAFAGVGFSDGPFCAAGAEPRPGFPPGRGEGPGGAREAGDERATVARAWVAL